MAVGYKDYYATLGLARDTSQEDIQRAYRKLARQYHPDLNKAADAEQKFKDINEAYQVLKDPEKRQKYDQLGAGWQEGQDFRPPPGWETEFDFGRRPAPGAAGGVFSDFFETLFGEAFRQQYPPGSGSRRPFVRGGADQEAVLRIRLEEALKGGMKTVTLTSQAPQPDGTLGTRQKTYDVKIPAGILAGQKIRLAGQGGQAMADGPRGDLYLTIEIAPHPRFRLQGRDLYTDVALTPWEAALGAEIQVPTPRGSVTLKIPAGTQSGQKLRLKGKGMPHPRGASGDLYAIAQIKVPKSMTPQEKSTFEELRRISAFNPRTAKDFDRF